MNADVRGFPRIAAALLPRLIAAGLLAWSLATAWAWTITGSLEPATLDVFGWHKRVLTFDPEGRLADFLNMDEP